MDRDFGVKNSRNSAYFSVRQNEKYYYSTSSQALLGSLVNFAFKKWKLYS